MNLKLILNTFSNNKINNTIINLKNIMLKILKNL